MARQRKSCFLYLVLLVLSAVFFANAAQMEYISAIGDPGMRRDGLRLAIESWNQCNEVGEEVPQMGSPRAADCFDIYESSSQAKGNLCNLKTLLDIVLNSAYIVNVCIGNLYFIAENKSIVK